MLAVPQQYRLEGGEEGTACKLLLAAAAAVEGDGGSFPVFPPLLGKLPSALANGCYCCCCCC